MSESFSDYSRRLARIPLLRADQEIHYGRQIQAWRQHPDGPDDCPAAIRRRGERATSRLVEANLRLVVRCARDQRRRLRTTGLELMDLVSHGNIGLIKAAGKFDPSRGYRFSTYAYPWICSTIARGARRDGALIQVPEKQMHNQARLKARIEAASRSGSPLSLRQAAQEVGMDVALVRRLAHIANTVSIDGAAGSREEASLLETVADPLTASGDLDDLQLLDPPARSRALAGFLALLSAQERFCLVHRYGLGGERPLGLAEIGRRLGISSQAAAQTIARAIHTLQGVNVLSLSWS